MSTYDSVLTIVQPLSDFVGHTYSCMVTNTLGSDTSDQLSVTGKLIYNPNVLRNYIMHSSRKGLKLSLMLKRSYDEQKINLLHFLL